MDAFLDLTDHLVVFRSVLTAESLESFSILTSDSSPLARYCIILAVYLGITPVSAHNIQIPQKPSLNSSDSTLFPAAINPLSGISTSHITGGESTSLSPTSPYIAASTDVGGLQETSRTDLWEVDSGENDPKQCPHCRKRFTTNSNRKKHVDDHCSLASQKLPCRNIGCQSMLKGEWYRKTHERDKCPFRRAV